MWATRHPFSRLHSEPVTRVASGYPPIFTRLNAPSPAVPVKISSLSTSGPDDIVVLRDKQDFSQHKNLVRETGAREQIKRAKRKRVRSMGVALRSHIAKKDQLQPRCDPVHVRHFYLGRRCGGGCSFGNRRSHGLRLFQLFDLGLELLDAIWASVGSRHPAS
jgi:hypothetical protein